MAKRQSTRKIDSAAVMGEGSFVVVSPVTMAEAKANRKALTKLQRAITKTTSALENGEADPAKLEALEAELTQINADFLTAHVLEWDWVDENDKPLPLPKDEPDVIDRLYPGEISFLAEAIAGTVDQKKS